MISTKERARLTDLTLADVKESQGPDGPEVSITSQKRKVTYRVLKTLDGYGMFYVAVEKGAVPSELSGRYSRQGYATAAVLQFLKKAPKSQFVKLDENLKAREEQLQRESLKDKKEALLKESPRKPLKNTKEALK